MTTDFSTPLLDDDGRLRLRRFAIATVSSAVVITLAVAFAMHTASPSGGWTVAFGVGAMVGFWMCPLAGAVIGNGFHEIMKERHHALADPTAVSIEPAEPVVPTGPSSVAA